MAPPRGSLSAYRYRGDANLAISLLKAPKLAGFFAHSCVVQGAGHYWLSDPRDEIGSYTGFFMSRLTRFLAEKL
jgi:hypothetical protein